MIKRNSDMPVKINVNMRDGDGQVIVRQIMSKGEYAGKARLTATLTLEPGCSIGEHVHENEEEIFYIIKGSALYNDNGTDVVLNEGDSCICLNGQRHGIANNGDGTLVVFAVILVF